MGEADERRRWLPQAPVGEVRRGRSTNPPKIPRPNESTYRINAEKMEASRAERQGHRLRRPGPVERPGQSLPCTRHAPGSSHGVTAGAVMRSGPGSCEMVTGGCGRRLRRRHQPRKGEGSEARGLLLRSPHHPRRHRAGARGPISSTGDEARHQSEARGTGKDSRAPAMPVRPGPGGSNRSGPRIKAAGAISSRRAGQGDGGQSLASRWSLPRPFPMFSQLPKGPDRVPFSSVLTQA